MRTRSIRERAFVRGALLLVMAALSAMGLHALRSQDPVATSAKPSSRASAVQPRATSAEPAPAAQLPAAENRAEESSGAAPVAAAIASSVFEHAEIFSAPGADTEVALDVSGNLHILDRTAWGRSGTVTLRVNDAGTELLVFDSDSDETGTREIPAAADAQVPLARITGERIGVNLGRGDDTLTLDVSGGLLRTPIEYDGGADFDTLIYVGEPKTPIQDTAYTPGPDVTEGFVQHTAFGGSESLAVHFRNLEPVLDNVVAATLTVNGNHAANSINYSNGPGGGIFAGATGLVSVDAFETFEFNNKTNLVINALAGSDNTNLNCPTNPAGLTGTVTVNGGDPSAGGDVLVVTGVAGSLDNLRYLPTAAGAGTVVNDDAPQADVLFTGTEQLTLVEQFVDGDGIRAEGTTGNDTIEYVPGLSADSGSFTGTMDANNATGVGPFSMVPMNYTGTSLAANDGDVNFFNPGGTDTLVAHGTANDDQILIETAQAGGTEFRNTVSGVLISRLEVFNIASLHVKGFDGDDTFTLNIPAGPSTVNFNLQGGSGDDVFNHTPSSTAANLVTVNLQTSTIQEASISGTVTYSGMSILNLNAASHSFTLRGTAGDDQLEVTAAGANAVSARLAATTAAIGATPVVNASAISAFTVDALAGQNLLTVNATQGNDTVAVSGTSVAITGQETVNYSNASNLTVNGLGGDDTFTATPSATTAIFVDGGNPVAVQPGDQLDVTIAGGDTVVFTPGPTSDAASFVINANQPVSYVHIESSLSTADLSLTKLVDDSAPTIGDQVVYTLTVTNNGPGDTAGVTVADVLPAGVSHISDDGGGDYVPGTGVWTIGSLANGASATLNITVLVDASSSITNTGEITASSLPDPDSTPNNGQASEDDQDSATLGSSTGVDPNDIDGDGIPNAEDLDDDNDGISDLKDLDIDGDGVNNDLDSSPNDPADAGPFGLVGTPGLAVQKVQVKLDFDDAGRDKIGVKGLFPIPPAFVTAGTVVNLVLGGHAQTFTLDEKGNGVSGEDKFKLRFRTRSTINGKFLGKWTAQLKKGTFTVNDVNTNPLDGSAPGVADRELLLTLEIVGGAPDLRYNVGTVEYKSTAVKGAAKTKKL